MTGLAARRFRTDAILGGASQPIPALVVSRTEGMDQKMEQLVSVAGALLIHAAYIWMNFVGALVLTVIAWRAQLWGFVLLEGAWAGVSIAPLIRRPRA